MDWLQQQIINTQQPDTILHLGSGLCSELDAWRQSGARRIILVEPNPELLPELQQTEQQHARVETIPAAVAAESGRRALKLFNFPLLNSLREPTGLYAILPGLAEIGQVTVDVLTPEKLVETTDLQPENINWLVVDTLGEEAAIISALEQNQLLNYFDRIIIQAGAESLYHGAGPAEEITRQLEKLGYEIEGAADTTDRDWPRYHLRLNPSAIECRRLRRENEALIEQKKALEQQNEELTEKLEQQKSEAQKRAGELQAAQKQAEQQKKELTAEIESLRNKAEEREQKLAQLAEDAIVQIDSNSNYISENFDKFQKNQEALEQRLLSKILPRIDNAGKQIEAYIGIQSFLQTGRAPAELHGWPISPDLALFLVKSITTNNYDLVIEFGSGSSTVLMAQALKSKLPRYLIDIQDDSTKKIKRYGAASNGEEENTMAMVSTNNHSDTSNEILPRLIAFEHMRKYHEETSQMLKEADVEMLTEVIYSPLIPQKFDGPDPYLYYDVEETLEALRKRLSNSGKKILALVDGPPGKTGNNARFPALSVLLKHFSSHQIEIVLDDTKREQEKEIVKKWKLELEKRGARFEVTELPFEKGALVIKYY